MAGSPNALRWKGRGGHYEVYYLTLTHPGTGVGAWIRYTVLAPSGPSSPDASCSLWFSTMDPRPGSRGVLARKATYSIEQLRAQDDPFELRIGEAWVRDQGMQGEFEDVSWDLRWAPSDRCYESVHPALQRLRIASTALLIPNADVSLDGTIAFGPQRIELAGARGGQAHMWGTRHASSWVWAHCNDLSTISGEPVKDAFVDGVSAMVSRLGREIGPSTPVVARIDGRDFCSTSPPRIVSNSSTFALTGWRFEAVAGRRKLVGEVDADRDQLAGVTYHDPDGTPAYCYNTETATLRLHVYERSRQVGGWAHRQTLVGPGRAHFEYAQRTPIDGVKLLTQ
jgi:hypothetical protein